MEAGVRVTAKHEALVLGRSEDIVPSPEQKCTCYSRSEE
jgi:hypothetical protein